MRTKIRAKIVDNLLDVIDEFFNGEEGHREDQEFLSLCERISGKEVDLLITKYTKGDSGDAFEAIDDNYWLPDCCWSAI